MPATHTSTVVLASPAVAFITTGVRGSVAPQAAPAGFNKRFHATYGGLYKITGTLKVDDSPDDLPVARQLKLLTEPMMAWIDSTWSDPATGAYEFKYLSGEYRYTIIGYDYRQDYRAVVADNVQPEPM